MAVLDILFKERTMKYRTASRIGKPVSEIGLGCWQIGSAGWGPIADPVALTILKTSVDAGVTFLDTADVYGDGRSEKLIGTFLKTYCPRTSRMASLSPASSAVSEGLPRPILLRTFPRMHTRNGGAAGAHVA